jgi:hypothetical protein
MSKRGGGEPQRRGWLTSHSAIRDKIS